MDNCEHIMAKDYPFCVKCDWTPDPDFKRRKARYSGPNRSGICVCGHSWEQHHLGMVVRLGSVLTEDGVREGYIPQECEAFGFNEMGGLDEDGNVHCFGYRDTLDNPPEDVLGLSPSKNN